MQCAVALGEQSRAEMTEWAVFAEDYDSEGGVSSEGDDEGEEAPEGVPLQSLTQAKAKVNTYTSEIPLCFCKYG